MSRIGKLPVTIPSGVKVALEASAVRLEGPKGKLQTAVPAGVEIKIEGNVVRVECSSEERKVRALYGLTRKLIANMAQGVSQGFIRVFNQRRRLPSRGEGPRDSYDSRLLSSGGFSTASRSDGVGGAASYHYAERRGSPGVGRSRRQNSQF